MEDVMSGKMTPSTASVHYGIPRSTISSKKLGQRPVDKGRNGPEAVLGRTLQCCSKYFYDYKATWKTTRR